MPLFRSWKTILIFALLVVTLIHYFTFQSTLRTQQAKFNRSILQIFALIGIANTTNRTPLVLIDNRTVMTRLSDINEYFPELIDRLKFVIKLPNAKSINLHTNGCCRFSSLNELMKLDDQYVIGNGIVISTHLI
ncbi:unnamed protein product, partial [Mesorhabditis belari]|uniref:Uncharacterized protein n=1 Tax=Mesorhabditis belari TaxID=2138241 RepID=A0AAF3F6D6_9BILA